MKPNIVYSQYIVRNLDCPDKQGAGYCSLKNENHLAFLYLVGIFNVLLGIARHAEQFSLTRPHFKLILLYICH